MKDLGTIITEEIERKEGREVRRTQLPIDKRKRLHGLLQAAKIALVEAEEKNLDEEASIEDLSRLIEDAAGSILEASELLDEQAKQLL